MNITIKQLEWDYFSPPKDNGINKVFAIHNFKLPEWMREKNNCCIEIGEGYYWGDKWFIARVWWFNRGVSIVSDYDKIKTEMKFFNENYNPNKVTVYLDLINENNKLYSKNVNEIKSLRFRLNNILINSKKDDSKI